MSPALLATKLFAPPPRQPRVHRPGLNAVLSGVLTHRLTLVSAPAGYGKTTLVSSWLQETGVPSAWLSLDEEDNSPPAFLQYFLAALQKVLPMLRKELLESLQSTQPPSWQALSNMLVNEITESAVLASSDSVIVLDDFHAIHAQPILEMLAFLLEHLPPSLHVILLSRIDPVLPLSRLRARNQLVELRAEHLRFNAEEITRFFHEVMRLDLPATDVPFLESRTEGWVAGLQLAALAMQGLSMQGRADMHAFIMAFTGSHSYIMDYLVDEVLKQQPEHLRLFLLQTAILDRLCGSLCQAVAKTDQAEAVDGQAMLETLEQNHLFVIPLDNERRWYRYHHLFKDMLNRRLETIYPLQLPGLYSRASHWYEQNGHIPESVQYARLSGDLDRTADLVEQHGCDLLMRGETLTLMKWLDAVEPYVLSRPWLAMQKAWLLLLTGHVERAEQVIQAGEELVAVRPQDGETHTLRGSFTAARAQGANMQADTRRAAIFARQALDILPESNDFSCALRSVATYLLGDASWMNGDLEEATRVLREAAQIALAAGNPHMAMMANGSLADLLMEQGRLHQAARVYTESLQLATRVDGPNSPFAGRNLIGLGRVFFAWHNLDDSETNTRQGIRLSEQWEDYELQIAGQATLARIAGARGDTAAMHQAIQSAEKLAGEHRPSRRRSVRLGATLARLSLQEGMQEPAFFLLRDNAIMLAPPASGAAIPYHLEPAYLVLLRLFLAQANLPAALDLSAQLLQAAETACHTGWEIEILVLQSLVFQEMGDMPRALASLERALALAQPENHRSVFLDEGERMGRLLYYARTQRIASAFGMELLSSLNVTGSQASVPSQAPAGAMARPAKSQLVEPLSVRELEVLSLIESGCSNQEIAARLVISVKTVKRHTSNIFGKLGVKNRTQAVSLARGLKLLA